MAFPWSRSDAAADALPADSRRSARGRRARQEEAKRESSRIVQERRHQRMAFAIGGGLILVIVAVLSFGVFEEFYKPPRAWAGSVRNVEFTMGDLVKRIRVLQGVSGQVNLGIVPFEYLSNLLDAEVLRQASPGLGITLTDEDIDEALRSQFYQQAEAGQQVDPGQLDQEYAARYQIYLERTNLTDKDYRIIVEERLALGWLSLLLGQQIADPQEQVEVEWIRFDQESGIVAEEVVARLALQEFAIVANDVGVTQGFADPNGYVGWIPRGAFPDLASVLYGDEDKGIPPLAVGGISDPIFTVDGLYIIRKLSSLEAHDLDANMRAKLNVELVTDWQQQQRKNGAEEKCLKMNFNSKWYAWVTDQIRISAPNVPQGQGGQ